MCNSYENIISRSRNNNEQMCDDFIREVAKRQRFKMMFNLFLECKTILDVYSVVAGKILSAK